MHTYIPGSVVHFKTGYRTDIHTFVILTGKPVLFYLTKSVRNVKYEIVKERHWKNHLHIVAGRYLKKQSL